MRGLGTIINALAIVIGGVLGILFKRFLKERYQDTIIKATGFSVVFLGAAGTLSKILTVRSDGTLSTGGSMVMILSLALGALLGELIDLDAQFERFGEWLKHKTGSDGDNQFVNGFVSASLTLGMVRTLKAQGVKTLVFTTLLSRSTTVSVDALLAAEPDAPDETAVVWTHTGPRAALTIGGADHSALLK